MQLTISLRLSQILLIQLAFVIGSNVTITPPPPHCPSPPAARRAYMGFFEGRS